MENINRDLPLDTNRDNVSPEDGFIKGREDSADNIEQGILSRAAGLDQSAPHSKADKDHKHSEITSFEHTGARNLSPEDIEEIKRQVDNDAEKQTGKPTGAIYGDKEDQINLQNSFPKE